LKYFTFQFSYLDKEKSISISL